MRYPDKIVQLLGQFDFRNVSLDKLRRGAVITILAAGYLVGMFFGYLLSR